MVLGTWASACWWGQGQRPIWAGQARDVSSITLTASQNKIAPLKICEIRGGLRMTCSSGTTLWVFSSDVGEGVVSSPQERGCEGRGAGQGKGALKHLGIWGRGSHFGWWKRVSLAFFTLGQVTCPLCDPQFPHLQEGDKSPYLAGVLRLLIIMLPPNWFPSSHSPSSCLSCGASTSLLRW